MPRCAFVSVDELNNPRITAFLVLAASNKKLTYHVKNDNGISKIKEGLLYVDGEENKVKTTVYVMYRGTRSSQEIDKYTRDVEEILNN